MSQKTTVPTTLLDNLHELIAFADELYQKLVLVVGPAGSGKTYLLQELAATLAVPVHNVNLEMSQQLLGFGERERTLKGQTLLQELVAQAEGKIVLLDNTELLFHRQFRWQPLPMLQSCAREKTVVAAWHGQIQKGYLIYAEPPHPDYRREPIRDVLTISLEP